MPNREILLYFPNISPENGNFIYIREGTGDNLFAEDIRQGYCDYVMYDILSFYSSTFEDIDGGQILLKENYCKYSEEEIIEKTLIFAKYNFNENFMKINIFNI